MSQIQARLMRVTRLDEAGAPVGEPFVTTGYITIDGKEPLAAETFEPLPCREDEPHPWHTITGTMQWTPARGSSGKRLRRRFVALLTGMSYTRMRINERKARGHTKRVRGRRQLRR